MFKIEIWNLPDINSLTHEQKKSAKKKKKKRKEKKKIKPTKQNKHLRNRLLVEKEFGGGWEFDRMRVEVHESGDWVRVERVRESGDWVKVEWVSESRDWVVERVSESGGVRMERVSMSFEF